MAVAVAERAKPSATAVEVWPSVDPWSRYFCIDSMASFTLKLMGKSCGIFNDFAPASELLLHIPILTSIAKNTECSTQLHTCLESFTEKGKQILATHWVPLIVHIF